jgi:streptomycin 6-kinase
MANVIRIEIDRNGKVVIDHRGFIGEKCFEVDEKLIELLKRMGAEPETINLVKKPEAWIKPQTKVAEKEV